MHSAQSKQTPFIYLCYAVCVELLRCFITVLAKAYCHKEHINMALEVLELSVSPIIVHFLFTTKPNATHVNMVTVT